MPIKNIMNKEINNFEKERIRLLQEQNHLEKEFASLDTVIKAQVKKDQIRERQREICERLLEISCQ
jgi:hypothetical protein